MRPHASKGRAERSAASACASRRAGGGCGTDRRPPALTIARGDVVVSREPLPKVNPHPLTDEPQWRFRVCVQGVPNSSQFFTSFTHAASRAEELATTKRTRLVLVEDDIPTLLADYRHG